MNLNHPEISVVVAMFNETHTVEELHRRLTATLRGMGVSYELVFVDDGSRDDTYAKLAAIHDADPNVAVFKFSRNFGHHIAMTAGLREARGRYVVMMDADLQDRPEDIPRFHAKIREGYACVYGVREKRHDSWLKVATSRIFLRIMNSLVRLEVPLNTCVFRMMTRQFVDAFNAIPERHRFITGLMSWMGFRQVGIPVVHDRRYAGTTKYSLYKMVLLALNSLTAFSFRPLQLASIVGVMTAMASIAGIGILFYRKLVLGYGVLGWTSLIVTILFLGGIQLIALGLLGEYVGRSYDEQKGRPLYLIEARHEADQLQMRTRQYA